MIKSFLLLCLIATPLFGAPSDTDILHHIDQIFGKDLDQDLDKAGVEFHEAYELFKLGLSAQKEPISPDKDKVERTPAFETDLPEEWNCFFETKSQRPLVICPKDEEAVTSFMEAAEANQESIVAAIQKYGAVVFSGFGFTLEEFPIAFEAATGVIPDDYQGDTPRDQVAKSVYKSTAVDPAHHIGLHQEEAALGAEYMPQFISFFCEEPPSPGTGRTLVASAREITHAIQDKAPDLWALMNRPLVSWAFYMPDSGFWTRITQFFNSSHATVTDKFGTNDPKAIQNWCDERGYTCLFMNDGVKIFHKPVPGTIELDGELTFCNQIHLSVRNAHLCGSQLNKSMADYLLYEQFGVQQEDGTPFTAEQADRLSRIIRPHEDGRDWQAGEIMIFDNQRALHGKTPHEGARKVYATMGGRGV